jgi:hypothetical protein
MVSYFLGKLKELCHQQKKFIKNVLVTPQKLYLFMGTTYINNSSPKIIPNTFTIKDNYQLSFWLFLPSREILSEINYSGFESKICLFIYLF